MKNPTNRNGVKFSLRELAELLKLEVPGTGDTAFITGFASLNEARAGDLSLFSNARYRQRLATTQASVVLMPIDWTEVPPDVIGLPVADPSAAFDQVLKAYGYQPATARRGVHRSAVLEDGVEYDAARVSIGANAVVEEGVQLGQDVEIGAGCYVGRGVRIGSGTKLFSNVSVHEGCILGKNVTLHSGTVIGADGFGYEFVGGRHRKIPQGGIVQIDDDVEIGANTTVDRARFGRTWIGEGTKIDNHVQIGHNVVVGKHCILVSGVGLAGSAQIGDYVVLAAQAGVGGHVSVGSQCTIGGRSGVTKDLPAGRQVYFGFPAAPAEIERRRIAAVRKLPELLARVKKLEEQQQSREG
jgi:UDP-3-O-[3-hydroxymyristoyl] glucosamine N-acyltransferase